MDGWIPPLAWAEEGSARLSWTGRASSLHGWVRDDAAAASAARWPETAMRRVGLALPRCWPGLEHERRTARGVHKEALRSELVRCDV